VINDDNDGRLEAAAIAEEANKALREGDTVKISRYFEDILDEIHTARGSSFWSDPGYSTAEAERREREDLELRGALAVKVTDALSGERIKVTRITENEDRDGYRVEARDNAGRLYTTDLIYQDAIVAGETNPVGLVNKMTAWIVEGIRAERDRYFRRMGAT